MAFNEIGVGLGGKYDWRRYMKSQRSSFPIWQNLPNWVFLSRVIRTENSTRFPLDTPRHLAPLQKYSIHTTRICGTRTDADRATTLPVPNDVQFSYLVGGAPLVFWNWRSRCLLSRHLQHLFIICPWPTLCHLQYCHQRLWYIQHHIGTLQRRNDLNYH